MTNGPYGEPSGDTTERMTVAEATERLGASEHAVRQRIRRGTLASEKDEEGRVWVFLSPPSAEPSADHPASPTEALLQEKDRRIEDLAAQLAAEREANRENRRIIAAITSRIPLLEAPEGGDVGASGEAQAGEKATPGGGSEGAQRPTQRPWWRRVFGGG